MNSDNRGSVKIEANLILDDQSQRKQQVSFSANTSIETNNGALSGDTLLSLSQADGRLWQSDIATLKVLENNPLYQANELIVQFSAGLSDSQREDLLANVGGKIAEVISDLDSHGIAVGQGPLLARVVVPVGLDPQKAIEVLSHRPGIDFAELNYLVSIDAVANDTNYANGSLWGMYGDDLTGPVNSFGSQADEAWLAGYTGSTKVVTGVIDTGIDYTHRDLYLNVWLNQGEISTSLKEVLTDVDQDGLITFYDLNNPTNSAYVTDKNSNNYIDAYDLLNDVRWENGDDFDANGYRDDLIGWDFVNNDNDPYDDNSHGTHVSGTIGGMGGNGIGVAGVNWATQIMPLKFLSGSGSGSTTGAIQALNYYTAMSQSTANLEAIFWGTNNSWGGGGFTQSLLDAIRKTAVAGNLFVAAAGNGGSDGVGDNNDSVASYPSNYSTAGWNGAVWDAVIAVAALNSTGGRASFSNYGNNTVDLGAPGVGIWSTVPGGGYSSYSGTSMATPHVAGALALLSSLLPQATPDQLISLLQATLIKMDSLTNITLWDGRLDISALIAAAASIEPPVPDTTSPTLTLSLQDTYLTVGQTSVVTFAFSEVVKNFSIADIDLSSAGGNLTNLTSVDGGKTWTALLTPNSTPGFGNSYTISVNGLGYQDLADNDGSNAVSASYTISMGIRQYGTNNRDTIVGTDQEDVLCGVLATGTNLGKGTIDTLTGGAGSDTFVLSDARGVFYNDGSKSTAGTGDYVYISDFTSGLDDLQLSAAIRGKIVVQAITLNGISGTGVYYDIGRNVGKFDSTDELVALVSTVGNTGLNLNSDFLFV